MKVLRLYVPNMLKRLWGVPEGAGEEQSQNGNRGLSYAQSSDQGDMSNNHFHRVNLAAVSIMEYTGHLCVRAEKSLRSQALISVCIFLVK